jgi:Plavaka transposase
MNGELFIEEYKGAAKEFGTGTTFMDKFDHDQFAGEHIKNLYYPFTSRNEWEFVAFLLCSNLSMASIDSLLLLNLVSVTCNFDCTYIGSYLCSAQVKWLKLSFGTARKLQELPEMLLKGLVWQCKVWTTVYLTKKTHFIYYDSLKCIQSILHSSLIKDYITFKPLQIFELATRAMCIYTEWLTGNAAWSMQVSSLH